MPIDPVDPGHGDVTTDFLTDIRSYEHNPEENALIDGEGFLYLTIKEGNWQVAMDGAGIMSGDYAKLTHPSAIAKENGNFTSSGTTYSLDGSKDGTLALAERV